MQSSGEVAELHSAWNHHAVRKLHSAYIPMLSLEDLPVKHNACGQRAIIFKPQALQTTADTAKQP